MVVNTKEEAKEIFKDFHISPTGTHMGVVKTRSAMCAKYYWHGMSVDVDKWVCVLLKPHNILFMYFITPFFSSPKGSGVWQLPKGWQTFDLWSEAQTC